MGLVKLVTALTLALFSALSLAADLTITDPWARATPPNARVGAVFVQIDSRADDELVSVSTDAAERVEIHSMAEHHGAMQMRPLTSLTIPAGKRVELSPTGTHLMLLGLKSALRAGETINVTFTFKHAGKQSVSVKVIAPGDR